MFDALLFDLDGTMLNMEIDKFLPLYFKEMVQAAEKHGLPGQELLAKVIASTDVMVNTKNPGVTNEEAFWADFQKNWQYDFQKTYDFFQLFYDQHFPLLKSHFDSYPIAKDIMNEAFSKGLKVVIATNSIFPLQAITERLNWAGIEHFPYDLITSYEIMHYCKPHPDYFLEIANMLQVKPQRCLMIGNDTGEDLVAGKVGMKTFLVENLIIDRGTDFVPDWRGSINDLHEFLKNDFPQNK